MHSYRQGIEEALTTTKVHLDKLHSDITKTLDKISSREKYLNSQLEAPLGDFRQLTDSLAATKEQYKQVSGGVTERSRCDVRHVTCVNLSSRHVIINS